ncbi:hypothetical protein TYRP_013907 [Tyrophagus putrescentiae]|nr:hypothetical protein TYRP_013907 [Tyrophagus putrescentiae]
MSAHLLLLELVETVQASLLPTFARSTDCPSVKALALKTYTLLAVSKSFDDGRTLVEPFQASLLLTFFRSTDSSLVKALASKTYTVLAVSKSSTVRQTDCINTAFAHGHQFAAIR